jgi:hypothetical protein
MALWLVEFLARLVKENKMADFDFANLGSMFGGGMGGTQSGLDALLTEDQRKLMGRNATLSAAAALLQASGRGPQRIGLGQALGSALQAGQAGYERTRAGSLQDLLLGEKLKEAQRLGQYQTALTGTPQAAESVQPMEPLTSAQASLLSQTAPTSAAGPFGPSPQRAQLMDQIQAQPTIAPEPLTATEKRYNELMRKADVANQFGKFDDADKLMSQALKIKPTEKYSTTPQFGNSKQGTPISFVLSESGGMKLLDVQRSPEFNYQDTGSYISVRDKNTNAELERIPKAMTPGEMASNVIAQGNLAVNRANLGVAQGNLGVAQGGLNLRQQEFARSAFDVKESPEGYAYIPKTPGAAAIPIMGAGGEQLKGVSGGKATEGERKAATLLSRMQLAQTQMDQGVKGAPGFLTSMTPRVGLPEERKRVEDAQLDFLDSALTLATGAAYTEFQLKGAMQSYFPKFGDDATTIAEKETRRKNLMEAARLSAGTMSGAVPPIGRTGGGGAARPSLGNIFQVPGG